jgi:hypothetical protein
LPIVKDSLKGDSFIQPFYIKSYFLEQYSVIHAPKTQHIKGRGVIPTENVLGFIEGTDRKDEVVVITAHYDHLGKDQGKYITEPMMMAQVHPQFWHWLPPLRRHKKQDTNLQEVFC